MVAAGTGVSVAVGASPDPGVVGVAAGEAGVSGSAVDRSWDVSSVGSSELPQSSYYSAVCLETGEVEWMELEGNSNSGTSVAFLEQLREKHPGPLQVIWDNAPTHRGEAVREYLRTPGLALRLVNPRFHEGRLCRGTARTSTPMRRSGAG